MAFEERWEGERLHFAARAFGQRVSGRVDVEDRSVRIEIDLPWLLASIADRIRSRITRTGTRLLEKK
jgi:hypothetical protein